jgi:hypothetical protein
LYLKKKREGKEIEREEKGKLELNLVNSFCGQMFRLKSFNYYLNMSQEHDQKA